LPFVILKSIKYLKDPLLINRLEMIIKNLSFSIVGMCGIQSLFNILFIYSSDHYKRINHNTMIMIFGFLEVFICFFYVYLVWRIKKSYFISNIVFGFLAIAGLWFIVNYIEKLNNLRTNNWIYALASILIDIIFAVYYFTIVFIEEKRKVLVPRRASVPRRTSISPEETINESDRVYKNRRASIGDELPSFLNRKEPELLPLDRLYEEEPTDKSSSLSVEKRRFINSQIRNRKGNNGAFF